MNPNHAKKKTRPYLLNGLSIGTVRAFLVIGLTSGADTIAVKILMMAVLTITKLV